MVDAPKRLLCYVSPAGRNKIADWYNDLEPSERADADEFIKNVRKLKRWEMPDYKPLGGGRGELRWISNRKQHRLIGYFDGDSFVLLIGCTHKQNVYSPTETLDTAKDRHRGLTNPNLKLREGSVKPYDL